MKPFLAASQYIDSDHPSVIAKAKSLSNGLDDEEVVAKLCFEFVRDEIKHSVDYELNPVTCKASDALKFGTGYCYAKSHLLAALLRANGIPAGLCYQRLTITDEPPFCLHGLNAVFLKQHGWYRIDPRGNKPGVDAQFSPSQEQLAFSLVHQEEIDLPDIYAEPLPSVISVLERYDDFKDVLNNLPDIS